jgi:hypothetical protein
MRYCDPRCESLRLRPKDERKGGYYIWNCKKEDTWLDDVSGYAVALGGCN